MNNLKTGLLLTLLTVALVVTGQALGGPNGAIIGAVVGYAITDGAIADPRIALFGVAGRPLRLASVEANLTGAVPGPEAFAAAAGCVRDEIEPWADQHASGEYRRHVAAILVERALESLC